MWASVSEGKIIWFQYKCILTRLKKPALFEGHSILVYVDSFYFILMLEYTHVSKWKKLNRRAQSNDLKTAFHVRNYLTQTRGGASPLTHPFTKLIIYFEYHFSVTQIFKF
jgi:hypothetical protein